MDGSLPAGKGMAGEGHDPPEWFTAALDTAGEPGEVRCDGAIIRYRRWGSNTGQGLVLVHGAAAHSGWWDHIAPLLGPERSVVALDLSGHGDSDRRAHYTVAGWGAEVLAVAGHAGFTESVLVGHSMGGAISFAAASLAARSTSRPRAVVALDSVVRPRTATIQRTRPPLRVYPDHAAAARRFRTVPSQPQALPFVLDHIARTSLRLTELGWTWRFDPQIFAHDRWAVAQLSELTCPAVLVVAEYGILDDDTVSSMLAAAHPRLRSMTLPGAHHHMMIDKPLETVAVVRRALAGLDDGMSDSLRI